MKDPLLAEYTSEELMYEYLDHTERSAYAEEAAEDSKGAVDDKKVDEAMKWADEEEAKEKAEEEARAKAAAEAVGTEAKPANLTPEDVKWMEEQMIREKEANGFSFGEDIVEEF